MSNDKKFDCKYLTTTQRIKIEKGLMDGESFASIARSIDKHPSTVAKEVKKYRYFPKREDPKKVLQCAYFKSCQMRFLCENKDCVKPCKLCYDTKLRIRHCSLDVGAGAGAGFGTGAITFLCPAGSYIPSE